MVSLYPIWTESLTPQPTYSLQVQLLLDPPLAVCGDVKLEFSSKLKLDMFAIKPKFMQPKKEFHFW